MTRAVPARAIAASTGILAGSILFLISLFWGPAAHAQDACTPADIGCSIETLPSGSTEPAEGLARTLGDAARQAGDDAGQALEPIVSVANDVLGDEPIVEPPSSGGTREGPGDPAGSTNTPDAPANPGPTAGTRESVVPGSTIISAASGARWLPSHRSPGRFGGLIQETVGGVLFLLVLLGFAVGFVMVQDRIDRNDPKLGAVPPEAEVVTFH